MKSVVKYIDSFSYGASHLQVNASFLIMLINCYGIVEYTGSKDCLKHIKTIISANDCNNIASRYYWSIKGKGKWHLLFRYIRSAIINIIELFRTDRKQLLFYNFNNLFSTSIINFLNKFLHRRIIILCHGELELLSDKCEKEGVLQRCLMYLSRHFFNKKTKYSDNIYFITLGESILNNLHQFLTEEQLQRFISIDHPYIFKIQPNKKNNIKQVIKVGTVGALSEYKGATRLIELSKLINEKTSFRKNIEISVVGQVFYPNNELSGVGIKLPKQPSQPIPVEDFEDMINNLDYILFLYDKDSYKLTASGAIFDAVKYHIPFIALNNDYFSYITSKYNIPGILVDEIADILPVLFQGDSLKIDYDLFDIAQKKLSPYSLSEDFNHKLQKLGII